ncbi:MAG: hypothetical protein SFU86_13710 [Pirellulaceae bacterium]|nr:hypothetical protein [Pirellulaceae bacterium]
MPKKVADRIASGLKRLGPIIQQQRTRDVSEADTVTLVKDLLSEVFGYDKYTEVTSEVAIRGTYCDLAVKLDDKLCELVEVKAIGLTLNDRHLKQGVDYGANQGIEWIVLTNAAVWQLHHIIFGKPIDSQLVLEVDLTTLDPKKDADIECLFPFTKEGFRKGAPAELRDLKDATSRYVFAALLLNNESVGNMIRRELRRIVDVNVSEEEIRRILETDVIKRDALEGPEALDAANLVKRGRRRSLRAESPKNTDEPVATPSETEIAAPSELGVTAADADQV